jgi:hypothetical protein
MWLNATINSPQEFVTSELRALTPRTNPDNRPRNLELVQLLWFEFSDVNSGLPFVKLSKYAPKYPQLTIRSPVPHV